MKIIFIVIALVFSGCSSSNHSTENSTPWTEIQPCNHRLIPSCTFQLKVPGGWIYYIYESQDSAAVFVPEITVPELDCPNLSPAYVEKKMNEVKRNVCP